VEEVRAASEVTNAKDAQEQSEQNSFNISASSGRSDPKKSIPVSSGRESIVSVPTSKYSENGTLIWKEETMSKMSVTLTRDPVDVASSSSVTIDRSTIRSASSFDSTPQKNNNMMQTSAGFIEPIIEEPLSGSREINVHNENATNVHENSGNQPQLNPNNASHRPSTRGSTSTMKATSGVIHSSNVQDAPTEVPKPSETSRTRQSTSSARIGPEPEIFIPMQVMPAIATPHGMMLVYPGGHAMIPAQHPITNQSFDALAYQRQQMPLNARPGKVIRSAALLSDDDENAANEDNEVHHSADRGRITNRNNPR
jgi:hypothetical protein